MSTLVVGQKVLIYDDGKGGRRTVGTVLAVGDEFAVISHSLWGYGDEALPQLYRPHFGGWASFQTEHRVDGKVEELPVTEWSCTGWEL